MFGRFTERAEKALSYSQQSAYELGHWCTSVLSIYCWDLLKKVAE